MRFFFSFYAYPRDLLELKLFSFGPLCSWNGLRKRFITENYKIIDHVEDVTIVLVI